MHILRRARRHLRRFWHVHLALAAAIATGAAFLAGAFAGQTLHQVFGQKLNRTGVWAYKIAHRHHVEQGQRSPVETLPPAQAVKLAQLNDQVAAAVHVQHPHPLATAQPSFGTSLVRNWSSRHGTTPVLWVVHDTESPNTRGTEDVKAIAAWFNNPASQASSTYTTDCDGNTLLMVPLADKAWTQAWFNPWSISDELIGYATETTAQWKVQCDAQLRAAAQLAAHDMRHYGIPIQQGLVSGCTIIRPGIVEHRDLGQCGGGHHDAGSGFPLPYFIGLVKAYAAGGYHPKPAVKPKPVASPTAPASLRARTGYWAWVGWRFGQAGWHGYGRANPTVRPNVPARVPRSWWQAALTHGGN